MRRHVPSVILPVLCLVALVAMPAFAGDPPEIRSDVASLGDRVLDAPAEDVEALARAVAALDLGEARAASLVATLDEQQTALLALPQNLELALELAPELADEAAGLRLPDSEEGLFRAVFEQQFAAWREAGTGDFIDLLTADAYAMLRDRAPATLPPEIASPLIERKLMSLPSLHERSRRLQRLMVGHATELELDGQGRLLVPPELREFAQLSRHAMLIGQGNRLELWDEARWNEQRSFWLKSEATASDLSAELDSLSL